MSGAEARHSPLSDPLQLCSCLLNLQLARGAGAYPGARPYLLVRVLYSLGWTQSAPASN
jgi:hypothetical protein